MYLILTQLYLLNKKWNVSAKTIRRGGVEVSKEGGCVGRKAEGVILGFIVTKVMWVQRQNQSHGGTLEYMTPKILLWNVQRWEILPKTSRSGPA